LLRYINGPSRHSRWGEVAQMFREISAAFGLYPLRARVDTKCEWLHIPIFMLGLGWSPREMARPFRWDPSAMFANCNSLSQSASITAVEAQKEGKRIESYEI